MAADLSRDLASLRIERSQPQAPPPGRPWPIYVGVAVVVIAAAAAAFTFLDLKLVRPEVRVGQVSLLSPAQADVQLMTTGYVVPLRKAMVASRIVARIDTIAVREGDDVKEGQVLATLESADVRAGVAEARAATSTAAARLASARASLADAEVQLERERKLFAGAASSQASLDGASSRVEVARANLAAGEAEVQSAAARLESADTALRNTRIVAPFAGRVVRKLGEIGEVPAGVTGGPGGVIELVDFASLVVEADVSEGRLASVRIGGPAEISLDAYPNRRLRGEVAEIRPTVDRQKATVLTRVRFIDPIDGVLPQMAAKVLFLGSAQSAESMREPPKVVVPQEAIVQRAGAPHVFVVSEGKVRLTPFTPGATLGSNVEVQAGPTPGTKIVLGAPDDLRDGDAIKEKPL